MPCRLGKPFTLPVLLAAVSVAIFCSAPACRAAENGPVLVVPPSPVALHIAIDLPASAKLGNDFHWQLAELGGQGTVVPAQLAPTMAGDGSAGGERRCVVADIPSRPDAKESRRFQLHPAKLETQKSPFRFTEVEGKWRGIVEGGKPVLNYNYGIITDEKVPKKDARRSRGCYIHPLWGLNGEILTDDFPKDHYHHHGVFWAWPHVGIGGKEYSLWEYKNIQPKFVQWTGQDLGDVAAVLAVENGWFVGDKKVMIERVWLRAYKASDDQRVLDLDFTWIPVEQPITLRGAEGKSYGGLTVRFAVRNAKDSVISVPGGAPKEDLPEKPLPWADLTTRFEGVGGVSGAAIFVPTSHPDYPPTWLTRHYGPQCVGWPGVRGKTFEPDKPIRLSYRLWIHKSAAGLEQLQQAYEAYTTASKVKWE